MAEEKLRQGDRLLCEASLNLIRLFLNVNQMKDICSIIQFSGVTLTVDEGKTLFFSLSIFLPVLALSFVL